MAYIELHDVVKDFKIKNRRNGAFGNVKNFFAPQYLNTHGYSVAHQRLCKSW